MTDAFWAGEFGTAYTARNRVDWRARIPFWRMIMELTGARSVFELGCNAGWNLSAIRAVSPHAQLYGSDVNPVALQQARIAGHEVIDLPPEPWFDLVFTAGVLIHVAPDAIDATMLAIASASADYVLAVEYAADVEEAVEYRGHMHKLWRRPFGALYEALGLKRVGSGDAEGFDRCTWWLLRK